MLSEFYGNTYQDWFSKHVRTIAFTGPRPKKLYGYQWNRQWQHLFAQLTALLQFCASHGTAAFLSGGAQGFDTIAFDAVQQIKADGCAVENKIYIPFPGQDARWSQTGYFGQTQYRQRLAEADAVIDVSARFGGRCTNAVAMLMKRNEAMIDDADLIIGLWNPSRDFLLEKGGTAAALRYAKAKGKPILFLNPDTLTCAIDIPETERS